MKAERQQPQKYVGEERHNSVPRLGICIPAYKRAAHLELCLRSAITTIGHEAVPIFVSDDSCDDTNREVISWARDRYNQIYWYRNKHNLGIDGNILSAVSICSADYAWLIGEDDLLTPWAVQRVLGVLRARDLKFLFANYSYVSNDYRYYLKRRVVEIESDRILSMRDFIQNYAWAMGFIGSCIINRRIWRARTDFVGTYYAHVGSVLSSVRSGDITMIADPLVLNRAENSRSFTWSDDTFGVLFGWERMLRAYHREDSSFDLPLTCRNAGVLFRHRTIRWLVSKRADGLYSLKTFWLDPRLGGGSRVSRALGFLVALCPRWLCRTVQFWARDFPRFVRRKRIDPTIVPHMRH